MSPLLTLFCAEPSVLRTHAALSPVSDDLPPEQYFLKGNHLCFFTCPSPPVSFFLSLSFSLSVQVPVHEVNLSFACLVFSTSFFCSRALCSKAPMLLIDCFSTRSSDFLTHSIESEKKKNVFEAFFFLASFMRKKRR